MIGGTCSRSRKAVQQPCRHLAVVAALGTLAATAAAQTPGENATYTNLPEIEVIGTAPLPGTGIDRDKVPANVQSLSAADLAREGVPSLITGLQDAAGSVSLNANLDDPFQPDLLYRGFEASPVLGTPEGIAVYQNGVRVNEAFGDTVDWDLIPDLAIDRVDIVSGNPVYGLNALGGAAIVTMKNGFAYQGFEGELAGGSFGQEEGAFQYGKRAGGIAAYIAGRAFDSNGWRQFSPDQVRQLYADIGASGSRGSADLSFTGADNRLSGEGATPEQELAAGRSLDFTTPQTVGNDLEFVAANASYVASDALSLQANAYRREFHETVLNGNTTMYTACTTGNGLLCQPDGTTPLAATNGAAIPDLSQGGTVPIGEDDFETIHAVSVGGGLQATYTGAVLERDNNLVVGASLDHATADFQSSAEPGVIDPQLQVVGSGLFVSTPENSGFTATPVNLTADNSLYGVYATDTLTVTPALAVTLGGRYNLALVTLADHLGPNLSGHARYGRFDPALGATYKLAPRLTAYAGYSEGNRVPSPSELECSNPKQPCLLPSSLSSDPPGLKQVSSRTYEAGLRGSRGGLRWNAGLFRTDLRDDIYGVATTTSEGFFENVGATRRQGIETGVSWKSGAWSLYGNYSLVDATFQSAFTLASPENPFADANGNIHVMPGDHLPGIPQHQLKAGADYRITEAWSAGAVLVYMSGQYFKGDESNQNPMLPGYAVVNLHSTYELTEHFELFATISNLLDTHYATYGIYGDPTGVNAPGIPAGAMTNAPGIDNRFISPAPPLAVFGGARVRF